MDMDKNSSKTGKGFDGTLEYATFKGEEIFFPKQFKGLPERMEKLQTFQTRHDDVWLLSYPKTGTHWLYEIMSILLKGELTENKKFKDDDFIEMVASIENLDRLPSPRILNTHLRLKYLPMDRIMKGKVLVTVRNPKSAGISYYNHLSKLKSGPYRGTFDGFLTYYADGVWNTYGSWFDYTQECWKELYGKDNVLFVFYEELKQNPVPIIQQLSKFLGVERDRSFCEGVAKLTSFEHMAKQSGKAEEQKKEVTGIFSTGKNEMFRKGTIDDWKNHFTVAQNERFDEIYEKRMEKYSDLKRRVKFESDK